MCFLLSSPLFHFDITFSHLAFERRFQAFSDVLVRAVTRLTFGPVPLCLNEALHSWFLKSEMVGFTDNVERTQSCSLLSSSALSVFCCFSRMERLPPPPSHFKH